MFLPIMTTIPTLNWISLNVNTTPNGQIVVTGLSNIISDIVKNLNKVPGDSVSCEECKENILNLTLKIYLRAQSQPTRPHVILGFPSGVLLVYSKGGIYCAIPPLECYGDDGEDFAMNIIRRQFEEPNAGRDVERDP